MPYRQEVIPSNYVRCYLPNRAFAVELETSQELNTPDDWTSCEDGSISGLEYHSGIVLGKSGIDRITSGCNYLMSENGGEEPIDRSCGYHLHINCQDFSEEQMTRFARFAYHYQPFFFMLVRKRRNSCGYSYILPDEFKDISNIADHLYRDSYVRRDNHGHHMRYYWANIHSYYYRGSVEIRLHHGVVKPTKVLNWIELMLKCVEYGVKEEWENNKPQFWQMLKLAGVRRSTIEYYKRRSVVYHGEENISMNFCGQRFLSYNNAETADVV